MTFIDPDMGNSSNIVPRLTIEAICNKRDHALKEYAAAYDKIEEAKAAIKVAYNARGECAPIVNKYNHHISASLRDVLVTIDAPDKEQYLNAARHMLDTDVWAYLVEHTRALKLLDATARQEFHEQLLEDPPEVTFENVNATLEGWYLQYGEMFKRSIARSFSTLDRRFKSHDGWKIGGRVVLPEAIDPVWRFWKIGANKNDILRDIERIFLTLDGKDIPEEYESIVESVETVTGSYSKPSTGYYEDEYFRVRVFLNGNVHIYFRRDDLLKEVNRLLGEYYNAPIPQDAAHRDSSQDDLFSPKLTPAKNFGLFPTPGPVRDRLFSRLGMHLGDSTCPLRFLEPQAGTGALSGHAVEEGAIVDCVEIQPHLAMALQSSKLYNRVINANFLELSPNPDGLYDRVGMNPPFDRERDIDHVVHALKFLKPGGILCAVMSAATEFRETRKSRAFRAMIKQLDGRFETLPERSFSSVGTNVNTVLLVIRTKNT